MPDTSKNECEFAFEIVIAVIQSGKMPSYKAEDVAGYYSIIYKGIKQPLNEEFQKTSGISLETY